MNVHRVLDHVRRLLLAEFGAALTVDSDFDPSLPDVMGDADQLVQATLNVARNGAQAVAGHGRILLRTRITRQVTLMKKLHRLAVMVQIIDNGPGIPPEIAADIFEPFVSGRENGTGLGLALVAKIVSDHGGWIAADSVPGRTVFRLSLPVAPKNLEIE